MNAGTVKKFIDHTGEVWRVRVDEGYGVDADVHRQVEFSADQWINVTRLAQIRTSDKSVGILAEANVDGENRIVNIRIPRALLSLVLELHAAHGKDTGNHCLTETT